MNKYYKIFGLQKSAHFEEVTKKYNELSKEFGFFGSFPQSSCPNPIIGRQSRI
jgi:hypothetical protein